MIVIILIRIWAIVSAVTLCGALFFITGYLILNGMEAFCPSLFFGNTPAMDAIFQRVPVFNGIFPAAIGSVVLVLMSVAIALPLGMGAGIYLALFASPAARKWMGLAVDILAGIPSIVIGLFGFALTIFFHKIFPDVTPGLIISASALAFLILPYLIRSTDAALTGIPLADRMAGLALGADRYQNLRWVLLPSALPGILSGVVLAIGRCAQDTAVIMLTGAVASAGLPESLCGPFEALPFYIYYTSSEFTGPDELSRVFGAALVLSGTCLILFMIAAWAQKKLMQRALGQQQGITS